MRINENLLIDSGKKVEATTYAVADYRLSEKPVVGETYTITIYGNIEESPNFQVFNSGAAVRVAVAAKIGDGIYRSTFRWTNNSQYGEANDESVKIYRFNSQGTNKSFISKVKLEAGDTATMWTPSREDVENKRFSIGGGITRSYKASKLRKGGCA